MMDERERMRKREKEGGEECLLIWREIVFLIFSLFSVSLSLSDEENPNGKRES